MMSVFQLRQTAEDCPCLEHLKEISCTLKTPSASNVTFACHKQVLVRRSVGYAANADAMTK